MSQQKIATRIVEQKLRASFATNLALTSIFEKFAIGLQDVGPGSGVTLRPSGGSSRASDFVNNNAASGQLGANLNDVANARDSTVNSFASGMRALGVDSPANGAGPVGSFIWGLGSGLHNQGAAIGNFLKGTIRGGTAAIAEPLIRPFSKELADDAHRQAYAGGSDIANSLGQYLGLHAINPGSGDFIPKALKEHDRHIESKYFGGDANSSSIGKFWRSMTNTANTAAESIPFAAAAPRALAAAKNTPVARAVAAATPDKVKNVAANVATYGFGLPAKSKINSIPFLASNYGQFGLNYFGVPGAEYLPANMANQAAQQYVGPWGAPMIDGALGAPGGLFATGVAAADTGILKPADQLAAEDLARERAQNTSPADVATTAETPRQGRRPFIDDAPAAPVKALPAFDAPSAEIFDDEPAPPAPPPSAINEPDLSDPFGDKEQPAPQLPPGAEYLPPGSNPADMDATSAAFKNLQTQQTDEVRAAVSDTNSPEAQKKIKEAENAYLEPASADYAKTNPQPTSPQEWGTWLQGMMDHVNTSWNNMSPEAQLAFGLGVPLAVIGLLSGNVGGFLLGAVGLGTAGIAAAGSGMFGDTAQTAAGSMTGSKTPEPIKPLSDDEQLSVVRGLSSASDPMAYVSANKNQFMQIANLPDDKLAAIAQQFDPQTRDGVAQILTQFNSDIDKGLKKLTDNGLTPGPAADAAISFRAALGGEGLPPGIKFGELPELKTKVERMLQILNSNQATPANNTGAYIQNDLIPKIARCWKGYEPVPGKKPYSEDSCRPQGSKKKKKMKKKAEDYLSFLTTDKPAILTLIRGYYDKQTGSQSKKVSA